MIESEQYSHETDIGAVWMAWRTYSHKDPIECFANAKFSKLLQLSSTADDEDGERSLLARGERASLPSFQDDSDDDLIL